MKILSSIGLIVLGILMLKMTYNDKKVYIEIENKHIQANRIQ